jgi:hypothetical protein
MNEGISKMWYIHSMEYYSALEKKEILQYALTCAKIQIYDSIYLKYLE